MTKLANLARMIVVGGGTGPLTLTSAAPASLTFSQAGINNGDTVSYAIRSENDSEVGHGVYDSGVLTRTTVLASTNGGLPIEVTGAAEVFITLLAEDLHPLALSGNWADLVGTPSTFPPSAHTHTIANITNLQTALDGKLALAGGTTTGVINFQGGIGSVNASVLGISDFNELIVGGLWSVAGSWTNGPYGAAATTYAVSVEVHRRFWTAGAGYTQIVNAFDVYSGGSARYIRMGNGSPGSITWGSWMRVATDADLDLKVNRDNHGLMIVRGRLNGVDANTCLVAGMWYAQLSTDGGTAYNLPIDGQGVLTVRWLLPPDNSNAPRLIQTWHGVSGRVFNRFITGTTFGPWVELAQNDSPAFTGKPQFPAATTSSASLNLGQSSVAPTSPVDGDVWIQDGMVYFRAAGTTRVLGASGALSTVSQAEAEAGTATAGRVWTSQRVRQAVAAYAPSKAVATTSADGLMSSADKTKLNAYPSAPGAVGNTLISAATAAAARSAMGAQQDLMDATYIELGQNRATAGGSYIDFHTNVSTDFDARIYRTAGSTGVLSITNTGTGGIDFYGTYPTVTHRMHSDGRFTCRSPAPSAGSTTGYAVVNSQGSFGDFYWDSPSLKLVIGGTVCSWNPAVSDGRFKENVQDTTVDALALVNQLRYVEFDWKPDFLVQGHVPVGLVAQEVEAVAPNLVNPGDTLSLNTNDLLHTLGRAIQQLSAQVEELKQELADLKNG